MLPLMGIWNRALMLLRTSTTETQNLHMCVFAFVHAVSFTRSAWATHIIFHTEKPKIPVLQTFNFWVCPTLVPGYSNYTTIIRILN
jgi:hypothetical protein